MTTNQTIDGVPRATLANFIEYSVPVSGNDEAWQREKAELRALLDAPAVERVDVAALRAEVEKWKGMAGRRTAERTEFMIERDDLKAAQPQGEPVALKDAYEEGFSDGSRAGDDQYNWQGFRDELEKSWPASEAHKLYAEQPAPVAVPRLEMAHVVRAHLEIPGCPVLTSNQCHGLAMKLNACLDEVTGLNTKCSEKP